MNLNISQIESTNFNFLQDGNNWIKGILADEIAIRFLFDKFFSNYDIYQFQMDCKQGSWRLIYPKVKPYRLWLHRYEEIFMMIITTLIIGFYTIFTKKIENFLKRYFCQNIQHLII